MKAVSTARPSLILLAGVLTFGLALSLNAAASAPAADSAELSRLFTRGRSQYLAGDPVAARETFRQIAERDPANVEAKEFLLRIVQDEGRTSAPVREQTDR